MRFFISYTDPDKAWAAWISWQLEAAGHEVIFQGWDFRPGENFVVKMRQALEAADRTLAVVSRAYLKSVYGSDEWTAAFTHDQPGTTGLLLVRVENVPLPRLLHPWIRIDLDGLDAETAARRLLEGVKPGRHKPDQAPAFPEVAKVGGPKAGGPSFPSLGPAISNLAPRNPNFTGRTQQLEAVRQRLTEASAAAVVGVSTLHGLGGVGKTQLALEYAHRYAAAYDLIWWVAAEEPLAIPGALAALAPRLGIPPKDSQQETTAAVLEELRQRDRWLLVYDNATDPAVLGAYRPSGGGGHVLVTSRNPAWLAFGKTIKVGVLPRHQAVELLIKRTGSANGAAVALADALGDLPLALEQAAAVVEETQMSLDEYLQLFGARRQELLAEGRPFMYGGTIDASVQLAAEQVAQASQAGLELLHLCAFLAPDAIPLDLLTEAPEALPEALAGAALDRLALERGAVAALLRYSLVDREPAGLRIHRLVQAVVEGSLAEKRAVWVERVINLLKAAWPEDSYYHPALWARCAQLLPHVVVAAGHAKRAQVALDRTAVLLTSAAAYARRRADFQAAQDLISQAVAIEETAPPSEHASVGWTLASLGNVLRERGDLAGARAQIERALQIHQAELGPKHSEVARDHTYLGSVLRELGELAAARAELECALELHQQIYAPVGGTNAYVARDRMNLGLVLHDLGDLPRARAELEQALAIDEAVYGPKHPEVARDRTFLGLVLHDLGDLEGARKQCEQALAIDEATLGADHPHVARNRANLGFVLRDLGDLPGARAELEQALAIDEAVLGSQHPAVGTVRWWLGEVLHDQGDVAGARAQLEGAHAILHAALGPEHPSTQAVAGRLADL